MPLRYRSHCKGITIVIYARRAEEVPALAMPSIVELTRLAQLDP